MALNIRITWFGLKGMDNPILFWIPPQLTRFLSIDFFRPLGKEHFYDSFALVSEISVRREALHLFGLRADELLPDLHITRDGVLRIGLGAHQEYRVNHVARATDRTKVLSNWQPMKWIRRLKNHTLVWARRTVWAVIPAQVVTLLETMES